MNQLPLDNALPCPQCQGRGTVYEMSHRRQDNHCSMCAGQGVISERPCNCGRPIIWYIGKFASCNAYDCIKKAKEAEAARIAREKSPSKVLTYPVEAY